MDRRRGTGCSLTGSGGSVGTAGAPQSTRQDDSGSLQRLHSGGVSLGTRCQQSVQIGPRVGSDKAEAQTVQTGASSTVRQASRTARAVRPWLSYLHPLGAAPEALE